MFRIVFQRGGAGAAMVFIGVLIPPVYVFINDVIDVWVTGTNHARAGEE
jgi:hypothetical protein